MFTVGQNVKVRLPGLMGVYDGIVLMNNLIGSNPLLVKAQIAGNDMCIQTRLDGSGAITAVEEKPVTYISYIFASGSATRLALEEEATKLKGTAKAIAAVTANRRDNGMTYEFYNYQFISFEDEVEEVVEEQADEPLVESIDLSDKESVKKFFDDLFGIKRR